MRAAAETEEDPSVDDFDPLHNEDDAMLGHRSSLASSLGGGDGGNNLRRTGSLLASAEAENEEERREEEDVVPDNLSRLPPGGSGVAVVSGRFTATPAMRMTSGMTSSSGSGGGAVNMARSLPVSVPAVDERVARVIDLPPEVDKVLSKLILVNIT